MNDMKRMAMICALAAALQAVAVAQDFESGGLWFAHVDDGKVEVVAGEVPYEGEVSVPSRVWDGTVECEVVGIGKSAFRECGELRAVTLPRGLEYVDDYAFYQCWKLGTVELPSTLTRIGAGAFQGRNGTTRAVVPGSVRVVGRFAFADNKLTEVRLGEGVEVLDEGAFHSCTLPSVDFPSSLREIGDLAFYASNDMLSVVLPDGVESVGDYAFWNSDVTTIDLGEGLSSLGDDAFGCCPVTTVRIPESLVHVGTAPFRDCQSLERIVVDEDNDSLCSIDGVLLTRDLSRLVQYPVGNDRESYDIPDGVKVVGQNAFGNCLPLRRVSVPDGAEVIETEAFYFCENLDSVRLGHGLREIGYMAFWRTALRSVTLPATVESIEGRAFTTTRMLLRVCSMNPVPPAIAQDTFAYDPADAVLVVPQGCREDYAAAPHWGDFPEIVEGAASSLRRATDDVPPLTIDGNILRFGRGGLPYTVTDIAGRLISAGVTRAGAVLELPRGTLGVIKVGGTVVKAVM